MELIIGSHVSFKKDSQLIGSVKESIEYKSTAFMFYTGAPQNTSRCEIDNNLTKEAKKLMENNGIDIKNVIVHAPYIINLANLKNFDFNVSFLKQEIKRVELLGVDKLVLHPGSHVGVGIEQGIKNIIDTLNAVINEKQKVIICLETMAGKGTELGTTFEQLNKIIDGVRFKDKVAVCMDTCHLNDYGYAMSDFDSILNDFDNIIGLDKLKVIHINDSKNIIGSHKDRHENIGYGTIGFNNLIKIIYNPKLKEVPKILETPYIDGFAPYKKEIEMIRKKVFDNSLK